MPFETVFSGYYSNAKDVLMEMDYLGEKVEVALAGDSRYVIRRLISTSPKAYLDPRLQPGSVISKY
jgi:hypothetical protein